MAQIKKFYQRIVDEDNAAIESPTVKILRVGAEVTRDASGGTTQIGVLHPGALRQDDVCYVLRSGTLLSNVTVTIADAEFTFSEANLDWVSEYSAVGSYTPTEGDRLVLTGSSPAHWAEVYDNEFGSGEPQQDANVSNAGVISCFVRDRDVDIRITSDGTTTYVTDIEANSSRVEIESEFATTSVTAETLWQRTIPAYFMRYGNGVRLTAWGVATGIVGTKEVRLVFGPSSTLATISITGVGEWRLQCEIVAGRDFGTQRYSVVSWVGSTVESWDASGNGSVDAVDDIVLKLEGDSTNGLEISVEGLIYEELEG